MRNFLFFCLFFAVCCLGCDTGGGSRGSKHGFNVGGKVTYTDGKPVSYGEVTFISGRFSENGTIMSDGTYEMNGRIPAGTYQITVGISGDVPFDAKAGVGVDAKYSDPNTSGLTCEVKGPTLFPIVVEPQK